MHRIYLDHNATTPLRPEARAAWLEVADGPCGNPSSAHASGRAARARVDDARARIALALGVDEGDVVFTSGATEANHLALRGGLSAAGRGSALVTTRIEHPSVVETARALDDEGHPVRHVAVDAEGRIDVDEFAREAQGAALASIAIANGEVGTLAPLDALVRAGVPERTVLHVDGAQALGRVPLRLREWGVRLASFSAHKVGGPMGVGVLVRRAGTPLVPQLFGGGQEAELRAGTENVAGIVAAACAIELAVAEREELARKTHACSAALWRALHAAVPELRLLGPPLESPDRLPNTVNVLVPGVEGRALVARLDLAGLEASAGSACASGSLEPSHVLLALGFDREHARRGLRLSSGWTTTLADVEAAVEILSKTIATAPTSARYDGERG